MKTDEEKASLQIQSPCITITYIILWGCLSYKSTTSKLVNLYALFI